MTILQYAQSAGYTPRQIGRYYTLEEHDSVRIDPDRDYFWRNSTSARGDVIDFVKEMEDVDTSGAIKILSNYANIPIGQAARETLPSRAEASTAPQPFTLPEKAGHHRNVYAYLTQTRGIDPEFVRGMLHNRQLYQDTRGNCVFVAHDAEGNPNFGCMRGTNTERPFKRDVTGSDYDKGFFIGGGGDTLVVTESVIDALSLMTIYKEQGVDPGAYSYLAPSGPSKIKCVANQLRDHAEIKSVVLAMDNDKAGQLAAEHIREDLAAMEWDGLTVLSVPQADDWNEDLLRGRDADKVQSIDKSL